MKQRDIVLIPFPFSDQSGIKVRPALILSNDVFNKTSQDLVVCAITTLDKSGKYMHIIDSNDLEEGVLYQKSVIKTESILRIDKSLIIKSIATVNTTTFSAVLISIHALFKPSK